MNRKDFDNAQAIQKIFDILINLTERVDAIEKYLCSECHKAAHDHH